MEEGGAGWGISRGVSTCIRWFCMMSRMMPYLPNEGTAREARSDHDMQSRHVKKRRAARSCGVTTHSSKYPARPCTPIFSLKVIRTCSKPGEWEGEGEPL